MNEALLKVLLVEDDEGQFSTWDLKSQALLPVRQVDQAEWRFDCHRHVEALPPLPQVEAR